jgi:GntR family transcriptional regulator, galactonate operon transcriptional repressor
VFERAKLSESLTVHLAREVVSGRLKPGDVMPTEAELSARFGVSKAIIRECIQVLAGLGVIHAQQGKRSVVLPRSDWNIVSPSLQEAFILEDLGPQLTSQFHDVRLVLEPAAAAWAAERADDDNISNLLALAQEMATIAGGHTDPVRDISPAYIEADIAFHLGVLQSARNDVMLGLLHGFRGLLRTAFQRVDGHYIVKGSKEHTLIAEAVAHHDAVEAQRLMLYHLSTAQNVAVDGWWSRGAEGPTLSVRS